MNNIYLLLVAVIIGITEGLTEFLPISSTGHMIIVGHLLKFEGEKAKTFEIVMQLGSILAIVIIFWQQILKLINIRSSYRAFYKNNQEYFTIIHILFGTIPTIIVGLLFHDLIKLLFNPINVMYALIVGSLLLIITECLGKTGKCCITKLDNITYHQAFIIGCFQCLALWPGFSRSGATISGGILVGMDCHTASKFSFLLAIPTVTCAAILDLYKNIDIFTINDVPIFSVGFITSFITALISIRVFLWITRYVPLFLFAIYRFILAGVVYMISF